MATGHKNSKSNYKGIRFPHEVIAEIEKRIEEEKAQKPGQNFSVWVIDACIKKLQE